MHQIYLWHFSHVNKEIAHLQPHYNYCISYHITYIGICALHVILVLYLIIQVVSSSSVLILQGFVCPKC